MSLLWAFMWAVQQMAVPACAAIFATIVSKMLEDRDHEGLALAVRIATAIGVGVFWAYPKLESAWFELSNAIGGLTSLTMAAPPSEFDQMAKDAAQQLIDQSNQYTDLMKPDMTGVPRAWWWKVFYGVKNLTYTPASPTPWADFTDSFNHMFGPAKVVGWFNEWTTAIWEVMSK